MNFCSRRGRIDDQHAAGLTREDVTAAVHYLTFDLTDPQVETFRTGDVLVECSLPTYLEAAALTQDTRTELLLDLLP